MTVGILLVTHGRTGETLVEATRSALGDLPLRTQTFPVPLACEPDATTRNLRHRCRELDAGDGVLILTDLYGSTPCNLSANCQRDGTVHVVSGINLAMLIKVMNYYNLDLPALTEKALEGGRNGIMECRK